MHDNAFRFHEYPTKKKFRPNPYKNVNEMPSDYKMNNFVFTYRLLYVK